MITTNALNMYRVEQQKRRAALHVIDEQRRVMADELKHVDSLIRVLENMESAEQKNAPKVQAEREAEVTAAYERGKLETIAAAEAAKAAEPAPAAKPRKRSK